MSGKPVLVIDRVTKAFGKKVAVDNISLTVQQGEIFGFLGPNGAGKSTTIRMILDILRPTSGRIEMFGHSNRDVTVVHNRIGYLSGEMVVDLDLTGRQYLVLVNNQYGGLYEHNIDRLAKQLDAKLDTKIGNYSRGNRQKIALISALMHEPDLLILDEPTSGFDPLVQATFVSLIEDYVKHGGTVFMSSHILSEVQELCDRVAFIKDGKISETKRLSDLTLASAKQVTIAAEPKAREVLHKAAAKLQGASGVKLVGNKLVFQYGGPVPQLMKYLTSQPITDVTIREPELEEIFGEYYEASS